VHIYKEHAVFQPWLKALHTVSEGVRGPVQSPCTNGRSYKYANTQRVFAGVSGTYQAPCILQVLQPHVLLPNSHHCWVKLPAMHPTLRVQAMHQVSNGASTLHSHSIWARPTKAAGHSSAM
jgi:hypothetical protein